MGTAVAPYADRAIVGVEPSDTSLVAAVRGGDDRAFEQLFERYQRRIAAYVYGMVSDHGRAEDLTQEIFISALRRMRETERPIAFKPWIYEIAKNACIDQFRRSKRTEEVSYDAAEGLGAADYGRLAQRGPTPDAAVDQKQALHDLCGAFSGLSETHHQILVLRELEGLSYREIGDRLGMSRPSVESTLFRARRRLSEEYDELASGQRCVRVQALISNAAEGLLGSRDGRRLARHLSHCQPCRRQARTAGVDGGVMARRPRRETLGAKIAGLFPFPAFLHRRRADAESVLGAGTSHSQAVMTHWSAMGSMAEPVVAGWSKAAAAAATIVLAGVGAGVGSQIVPNADGSDRPRTPASDRSASSSERAATGRVVEPRAPLNAGIPRPRKGDPRPATSPTPRTARRPSTVAPTGPASAGSSPTAADAPPPARNESAVPTAPPQPALPAPGTPGAPAPPPGASVPGSTGDPKATVEKGATDAVGQVGKAVGELQRELPGG